MAMADIVQALLTLLVLAVSAPLLGSFFVRVYEDRSHYMKIPFGWIEQICEKFLGESYHAEMNWRRYTVTVLLFNAIGFLSVFLIQLFQSKLPFNPQALPDVSWHSALNTAISFMTNTNWQSYAGETTLSYLVQFFALTGQNFMSAATGMAIAVALCRGLSKQSKSTLGSFWADLVRSTVYILLPLSLIFSIVLVASGVVQSFSPAHHIQTLSGVEQVIPLGPAASQIAIKQLGTNGGGFFNVNSAHPFENPTPFSNWLELLAILLIPAGFTFLYGRLIGNLKQGRILFSVMVILLVSGLALSLWSEYQNVLGTVSLEGKETRIGVTGSILWSTFTSAASNGSVNAMHSSITPIAGGVAMLNMMLGEIIFGGVGAGLYGMLVFVLLTVFMAGLMVGRTPEYLGKKIEALDIKMAVLAILLPSACVLLGTALAVSIPQGLSSLSAKGPHAFSEVLYAFTSASNNNGSAFAGLNANTVFYNVALGVAMLIGRFGVIIPVLAIAGNFAQKKYSPPTAGTFNTDTLIFAALLIGVILIVGGLTFFPALVLGPGIEHFLMKTNLKF